MEAGRELNVKVAERLGWTEVHFDDRIDFEDDERTPLRKWVGICPGQDFYRELPYFQEDIAAAFEGPARYLRDKGMQLRLVEYAFNVQAGFVDLSNIHDIKTYVGSAKTMTVDGKRIDTADAEAICLAFLKATEG